MFEGVCLELTSSWPPARVEGRSRTVANDTWLAWSAGSAGSGGKFQIIKKQQEFICFLRSGPSKGLKIIKNRQLFILFLEIQKIIKIHQTLILHIKPMVFYHFVPQGIVLGSLFFHCSGFPTKTNGFCIIYVLHFFIPFSLRNIKFYAEKWRFLTFPTSEKKSRYFKFCHTSRAIFTFSTSCKMFFSFLHIGVTSK